VTQQWAGRKVTAARTLVATWLPMQCGRCPRIVDGTEPWVVGHKLSRATRPDLMWDPGNWQPEHRSCSDKSAQAAVIEKARAEGARDALSGVFPASEAPESPRTFPNTHTGPHDAVPGRDGLTWPELCRDAPDWLEPYLEVPGDAAPPLWVSSVHPDAVGSYGPAAIEWMEATVVERGRPLRLRWWQVLAIVLQLQHRADGTLCWRVVIESGPRRIGKSVRLRAMALWRLQHGPIMFEPEQLVLHTGKDLAIVREVMRKAWAWADPRDDWDCKRGMTEPEVSYQGVNRWVARSKDSTTGYDACLALCDEAWDVPPASIDDDLEPTMLERESPQLVLTSTAHRRATSLMRGRITDALAVDDGETMLLVWSAPPGADPGAESTWRASSPHWSEDRRRMMASKYAKAVAGETDPEADDPDPMQGFLAQYLNRWTFRKAVARRGSVVIGEQAWLDLVAEVPAGAPVAAAVESWFEAGVSLAVAHMVEDRAVVSVRGYPDLASAIDAVKASGHRGRLTVGASLLGDPALRGVTARKGEGRVLAAVQELQRLISEDVVRHDGGDHLTGQVLDLRTLPSVDGPRMSSQGRADAVKAAVWAIGAARTARKGKPRVVVAG
jgi:hypothetical protein